MKPKLSNVTENWKNRSLENITEEIDGIIYTEKWKDIIGYEGHYKISTFGRVKSLMRLTPHYRGGFLKKKALILSQGLDTDGYPQVLLCINGVPKGFKIHQLVAAAYIKNKDNKPTVNHKFGVKTDNRFTMLEWFTVSEQTSHSYRVLNRKLSSSAYKSGNENKKSISVNRLNENGMILDTFNGIREAQRETGVNRGGIMAVCNGKQKTAGNYKWEYA